MKLQTVKAPSLIKLGASLLYELLTIIAIVFVSAAVFLALFGDASTGFKRFGLQLFLWAVLGAYYIRCWLKSGQTLAMQAWKIKLVNEHNQPVNWKLSAMRYVLATLSLSLLGLGFLWAIFDKEHLFLHDRLLNTKLVLSFVDVAQHSQTSNQE